MAEPKMYGREIITPDQRGAVVDRVNTFLGVAIGELGLYYWSDSDGGVIHEEVTRVDGSDTVSIADVDKLITWLFPGAEVNAFSPQAARVLARHYEESID